MKNKYKILKTAAENFFVVSNGRLDGWMDACLNILPLFRSSILPCSLITTAAACHATDAPYYPRRGGIRIVTSGRVFTSNIFFYEKKSEIRS